MEKIVAVIPAVGSSVKIPQNNIRDLAGKHVISYVIESAQLSNLVDLVIVIAADPEVISVANQYECYVIERLENSYSDAISPESIVWDAFQKINESGRDFEFVLILNPFSPLLRPQTIQNAIQILMESPEVDTVLSVLPENRHIWEYEGEQWIKKTESGKGNTYIESGTVIISRRGVITPTSWVGNMVRGLEINSRESMKVVDWDTWSIAERTLKPQIQIAFVVNGDEKVGLGHIYRGLALKGAFVHHGGFVFLCNRSAKLGVELLHHQGAEVRLYQEEKEVMALLDDIKPNIVINDILDTTADYVASLKMHKYFVVNFEDLGNGSLAADLVINALYDDLYLKPTHFVGPQYECLREEFLDAPIKELRPDIKNILVTFGGIDIRNSTVQVLQALEPYLNDGKKITVILGLGYPYPDQLEQILKNYSGKVQVHRNVSKMSEYILDADLVFTSAGRTVLEVMSIGTPCIVLVQNARETRHSHANSRFGIMNLGMGEEITLEKIAHAYQVLAEDYSLRQEMHRRMLQVPVRDGYNRVKNLILNYYHNFKAKSEQKG
jgi:spore coat polysaccharide biosynthesis predicted glycosyltransferase SpsG/CMP-N-acetylneuraminic acid synthetase